MICSQNASTSVDVCAWECLHFLIFSFHLLLGMCVCVFFSFLLLNLLYILSYHLNFFFSVLSFYFRPCIQGMNRTKHMPNKKNIKMYAYKRENNTEKLPKQEQTPKVFIRLPYAYSVYWQATGVIKNRRAVRMANTYEDDTKLTEFTFKFVYHLFVIHFWLSMQPTS